MHFCITGTGRCGTRLFRNLFNSHPQLYVYNETHWIPKMFEFFGSGKANVATLIDIVRRTYFITGEPVTALDALDLTTIFSDQTHITVAEFCNILGLSFAHHHGKKIWADKTPDYGPYLHTLQVLWPKCRVVHVIRHGKEVALSMSRHPGFRWMASAREMWWCPASFNNYYQAMEIKDQPFADYIALWYWRLLRIRNEAKRLRRGSYLEVKFEDMIERPAATLKKIAAFVKIPIPKNWLNTVADIIDVDRIHCRADSIPHTEFKTEHRQLLKALGYDY